MDLSPKAKGLVCAAVCLVLAGCSRDTRLAGRNIRSVTVRPVTHYGMTLDAKAAPKQVAYVLLRAIRDDFFATMSAEREAALDVQFDVCAANVIAAQNKTSVSRDEFIYNVVYHWTPTVSHYAGAFETDWAAAEDRLVESPIQPPGVDGAETERCEVRMELEDPQGDPNASVVMIAWLARDTGLWRVTHLGFDRTRRHLARSG